MRKYSYLCIVLTASAILLPAVFATIAASGNTSPSAALILRVVKDVDFRKSGTDSWNTAKTGGILASGDEVKTGSKSLALIKFLDNSLLRVRENSSVRIYADKRQDRSLSKNTYIERGRVNFEISKQKNDEFRFTTPTIVASIRGTRGSFNVMDDGTSLLLVDEGSIEVTSTVGEKQKELIGAGRYALVQRNGSFQTGEQSEEQKKNSGNDSEAGSKKLIIKTSEGDLIIEYQDEDK